MKKISSLYLDDGTSAEQLAMLQALLRRAKSRPGMLELTAALSRMLRRGQIVCKWVRHGPSVQLAFVANVTREEIGALLPSVSHPVAQSTLRVFLEGMYHIDRLNGRETELEFCQSEEVREKDPAELLLADTYPSGVPHPKELEDANKQFSAELAVSDYLGISYPEDGAGWLNLYIDGQSVEVKRVSTDRRLIFTSLKSFKRDLVIAAELTMLGERPGLLGWADRARFKELHRKIRVDGKDCCALDVEALLDMELLRGRVSLIQ